MIDLTSYMKKSLIPIKVIPNSTENKIIPEQQNLRLYLKAAPEKDKANKAVIKFFKDNFNLRVRIKQGEKDRHKILEIIE